MELSNQELTLISADVPRRFSLSSQDMARMADEMRRNLALWVREAFAGEGDEDAMMKGESGQIFEALLKRFPHLPREELKVKSCMIAKEDGQSDIWKSIVTKMDEANKNEDPNAVYKRFRLAKGDDQGDTHMEHFYLAACQFHKMALKWATTSSNASPLPLRTLARPEDAIDHAELEKLLNPSKTCQTIFGKQHTLDKSKDFFKFEQIAQLNYFLPLVLLDDITKRRFSKNAMGLISV